MAAINLNSIYDGVSLALHAAFPDRQVHGGEVKQGLKAGDFNVLMPSATQVKELGPRYRRTPLVSVIYYPKTHPCAAECHDMADRLTVLLESIKTPQGDTIHSTLCEWYADDDVLTMTLRYDHSVYYPQEPEPMETLEIKQEV